MKKYRYYLRPTTRRAVASFRRNLPNMGRIVKVRGTFDNKRWYRVTFINDQGDRFQFYGFAWFYHGEGPRGLQTVLQEIGVSDDIVQEFTNNAHHGDNFNPNGWQLQLA